jgi:hypothetical protein
MGLDATVYCDCVEKGKGAGCKHGPDAELVSVRLGNVALIGFIHEALSQTPERFEFLLTRVVYNGIHSGDFIAPNETDALALELERLSAVQVPDEDGERFLRGFQDQLQKLVEASRHVQKPIVFE